MVQPVQPRGFEGSLDLDATPVPPQSASGPPPLARDPSQIPDLSHLTRPGSGLPVETRPSAMAGPLGPSGARGPSPSAALAIQRRLDAFMAASKPTYHTPEGDAQVSTPFRMRGGYPAHEAAVVQPNDAGLRAVARSIGMTDGEVTFIKGGRATPGQVQRLTQGLIDAGRLPSPEGGGALDARIRQMMFDHGIGMDCAGYVRQAFVAAHPGASSAHWRAPANEDLSGLASRGFIRLRMSDAQSGDLIVLRPPNAREYGHTLVVRDARPATSADIDRLKEHHPPASVLMISQSPRLRVFELDSSWGCGGNAAVGGAQRMTWYEDEVSGQWVSPALDNGYVVEPLLYGHEVDGVYRLSGRP